MFPKGRSGLRHSNRAIVDCGSCPQRGRCWEEAPLQGSGFLVQPEMRLERGAVLSIPSKPSQGVFVVVSGCLTLRETTTDGRQRVAGFRLPGELVGLESWARADHPYEIRAAIASMVCRPMLPRFGHGSGNSALLERLLAKSAAQIDHAMRPSPGLMAAERVAAFVEDYLRRAHVKGTSYGSVRLPITRADIGSYLGLAEETVVRALASLKRARRLDVHGRMISLGRARTAHSGSA